MQSKMFDNQSFFGENMEKKQFFPTLFEQKKLRKKRR